MPNNDGLDILARDAQKGAFGMPSEQCPICGMPAPRIKSPSKEAQFQNEYGIHYMCARDANSAEYQVFEKNFKPLEDVAKKKREQTARAEEWARTHPEGQSGQHMMDQKPEAQTIGAGGVGNVADVLGTPEPPAEEAPSVPAETVDGPDTAK